MQVTPLVVTSHPSLASLSPTSRGCLLPHESALAHHAAYSVSRFTTLAAPLKTTSMTMLLTHSAHIFSSCRLECGLARAESEVHCVPWALPRGPGVKVFVSFVPLVVLNTILICTNPIFHQVAEMQILRLIICRSPGQYPSGKDNVN